MSVPDADQLLAIVHLVRPHGVRGEISAIPLAPPVVDGAEFVSRRLYARRAPAAAGGATQRGQVSTVKIINLRPHQDRWLITLEGVESMDQAEEWRGVDLCLPREELPLLPEGWYWEADLLACRVNDATLGDIGAVDGLDVGGAQPQLRLRRHDGAIALIPWVRAFIVQVDLEHHIIQVDLPAEFPGISASDRRE